MGEEVMGDFRRFYLMKIIFSIFLYFLLIVPDVLYVDMIVFQKKDYNYYILY